MPKLRTQPDQQLAGAIEELEALTTGNRTMATRRSGPDQVTLEVGQVSWPARVITRSSVSVRDVQELIATEAERVEDHRGPAAVLRGQGSPRRAQPIVASLRLELARPARRAPARNHPKSSGTIQFQGEKPGQQGAAGGGRLAAPRRPAPTGPFVDTPASAAPRHCCSIPATHRRSARSPARPECRTAPSARR